MDVTIVRFAVPGIGLLSPQQTPELEPSEAFLSMEKQDWVSLTIEEYRTLFKGSAVKRAKYEGLIRNLKSILPE